MSYIESPEHHTKQIKFCFQNNVSNPLYVLALKAYGREIWIHNLVPLLSYHFLFFQKSRRQKI